MAMRSGFRSPAILLTITTAASACLLHAQDEHRGRKYSPPPPVAHITVTVTKGANKKPVESAAVIFHTVHNGKDQGNLEVKTNEEGRAVIDVIPIGDQVRLQVIKSGYQTFGEDYTIEGATKDITVALKPPAHQYSIYEKHPDQAKPDDAKPAPPR
jgi:hypothetical protein